jgi:peptide/nickel transport system ATP-binding protein
MSGGQTIQAIDAAASPYDDRDETVLDVKDLIVHYVLESETVEAVNGLSFTLKKGQTLGLVGETGAGKTSTALAILNLVPNPPGIIKSGDITVCGHKVLEMSSHQLEKIRGNDVAMIFQDPMTSLNPVMTVGEQIAESIRYHENLPTAASLEKAGDMLELVGIPRVRAFEYPHQFSGGMKQRVIIAISLACNPRVLLADEPTTALDVTIQAQILDLMSDLKEKLGTALLMITHDLGVVAKVSDRVAVMYAGKIVEYGTLKDIYKSPLHPYTEGLFNSLPNVLDRKAELIPIPGLMPDPTKLPPGCAFEPRCKYAVEACKNPCVSRAVSDTHSVLCARYDEMDFMIDLRRRERQRG